MTKFKIGDLVHCINYDIKCECHICVKSKSFKLIGVVVDTNDGFNFGVLIGTASKYNNNIALFGETHLKLLK